jgi:hypothetical protein
MSWQKESSTCQEFGLNVGMLELTPVFGQSNPSSSDTSSAATDDVPETMLPPVVVTAKRLGPNLTYGDGNGSAIATRTLSDGSKVLIYADGYSVYDPQDSQVTFVPSDMSAVGPTLSNNEYQVVSDRATKLTWSYDSPGAWHDLKSTVDGWLGITPNPTLTSAEESELTALRGIVSTRVDAAVNPEKYDLGLLRLDAAANGPFGALAVILSRSSNQNTQRYAAVLGSAADNFAVSVGSAYAVKGELSALRYQGTQGSLILAPSSKPDDFFNGLQMRGPQRALDAVPGSKLTAGVENFVTVGKNGDFNDLPFGKPGDKSTTLLWTIDKSGVHFVPEQTPWDSSRGIPSHTNISDQAYFAGEAWRTGDGQVTLNTGSRAFGYNWQTAESLTGDSQVEYLTEMQLRYSAAIQYMESLGLTVTPIPLGQR